MRSDTRAATAAFVAAAFSVQSFSVADAFVFTTAEYDPDSCVHVRRARFGEPNRSHMEPSGFKVDRSSLGTTFGVGGDGHLRLGNEVSRGPTLILLTFWPVPILVLPQMDVGPGSYVALVTPMTYGGQVDEEALQGLIRWHVDSGTDGLVVLGTTGEASVLSVAERQLVLGIAAEETRGKMPLIAGTSSINPQVVVEQTMQAAECGADAVLVVTPAYVKPSQNGLVKFYEIVADQGALPVVLYNVPGRTAVDMGTAAVAELAKHPRIIGLKDATGDLSRTQALREACPSDFLFYSGDDETGMEYMLGGGNGVVSVTANVAPGEMSELAKACREGNRQAAEAINNKVVELHTKLFVQGNPVTVKYALARVGRIYDVLRIPLVPMEEQFRGVVDQALESAGLLSLSQL